VNDEVLRILIVDDHPAYRAGLRTLLSTAPEVEVVGEAETGPEAIERAMELQPDVVLMDLQLPGLNGIECTRQIVQASPHISVLMLTMSNDADSIFAAIRAGALGYLLKDAGREEILRAAWAANNREAIFGPTVAQRVIHYFQSASSAPGHTPFPHLTEREREVLTMIAGGLNNGEISRRLVLSPKTVRNHVSNIFSKLHVADRAQAILLAREAGLGHRKATGGLERHSGSEHRDDRTNPVQ